MKLDKKSINQNGKHFITQKLPFKTWTIHQSLRGKEGTEMTEALPVCG